MFAQDSDSERSECVAQDVSGDELSAVQRVAKGAFDTAEFKTQGDFDVGWKNAQIQCQKHAQLIALFMVSKAICEDLELPEVPMKRPGEENKVISIYSLAFLRMKVAKYIRKVYPGDRPGLKTSHGPQWAKKVLLVYSSLRTRSADAFYILDIAGS